MENIESTYPWKFGFLSATVKNVLMQDEMNANEIRKYLKDQLARVNRIPAPKGETDEN